MRVRRMGFASVRGERATLVTWAPPGLRLLEGTFIAGELDVTENTARPNVLSIVATRDGDRLTGEWREGRDRHAFTTRKPTPFAARGEAHALSGWLGPTRIRARLQTEKDQVRGAVLYLGAGERTLTGTLDAIGQVHLEESRGDQKLGAWQGAFVAPDAFAGRRSSHGEPEQLFTLAFTSSYPAAIALWNGLWLAPEVYHAESSRECWADTTIFRVTGLADIGKQESLDLELTRFIGVRPLAARNCFEGSERWATVTWKKAPFAQIELNANGVEQRAIRCAIVDVERGHLVKLFDLVKDHVALDRSARTMCMEEDHVTVEDEALPQTTIPKSELARIFDVRSPIGKGLFQ